MSPRARRPKNARGIARVLAQRFSELDVAGTAAYQAGLAAFEHRLDAIAAAWNKTAAPLRGVRVVTHHNT